MTGGSPVSADVSADPLDLLDHTVDALGGTRRDGQRDMATAVASSIETQKHLAVQAGTGTGKSLAYLVPALRHAVTTGNRVVVSTATLALQRQLVDRDLPRVTGAVASSLGREPSFAILGPHNYLCLNRVGAPASLGSDAGDDGEDASDALLDSAELTDRRPCRPVARLGSGDRGRRP